MIKLKKKSTTKIPEILLLKGAAATEKLKARFDTGERNFNSDDFESSIYNHPDVKASLRDVQNHKCCFCESKISHIAYGDVEHYRPKAGWIQESEALNKPGYYWLAYDWFNLFLSCEICNQRYKKNLFPLLAKSFRARNHHDDVNEESPVFLNPDLDEVEDFISFNEEIPIATNQNNRGKETIIKLGLDRELLNERRRKDLNRVRMIYDLAKGIPDTSIDIKDQARTYIQSIQTESQLDETEYSSMLKAFFRRNPINF